MNIQSVSQAYGAQLYSPVAKSGKKTAAPEQSAAAQNEQVEISEESLSLQKVKDKLAEVPEIRIELVEQIKTKIKLNGYPIESNLYKAVEKMVDHSVL